MRHCAQRSAGSPVCWKPLWNSSWAAALTPEVNAAWVRHSGCTAGVAGPQTALPGTESAASGRRLPPQLPLLQTDGRETYTWNAW